MTHLTVAFASPTHARAALRFLSGSALAITTVVRPCCAETELALVDVEVPTSERDRLGTLLAGVHGIVIEEQAAKPAAVA